MIGEARRNSNAGMEHTLRAARQNDTSDMSEAKAIRLAQRGDANAFERLYKLHCQQVYGLCLSIVGDATEAEELTREAFLQLFRGICTYRGESSLSAPLHRLTVSILVARLAKKQHHEPSFDAVVELCAKNPPENLTTGEVAVQLETKRMVGSLRG